MPNFTPEELRAAMDKRFNIRNMVSECCALFLCLTLLGSL